MEIYKTPALDVEAAWYSECPLYKVTSIPYIFPSFKLSKPVQVEICLSSKDAVLIVGLQQLVILWQK